MREILEISFCTSVVAGLWITGARVDLMRRQIDCLSLRLTKARRRHTQLEIEVQELRRMVERETSP